MSRKKRRQTQRQRTQRQQKRLARKAGPRPASGRRTGAGSDDSAAKPSADDAALQRWSRLLTKAEKDPGSVLGDPRCLKPRFVERFFDLCDGKALEAPWAAPDYAEAALALAEKLGDRHQTHRALGIAVHVCIAQQLWAEAAELLEQYREQALECCAPCASDWLRRQGDLLVEARDPELSHAFLEAAAKVLGDGMADDTRGRILFVRGVAHHFLGHRGQALDDTGEALQLLSLQDD